MHTHVDPTLRTAWLSAMRASTSRAIGRECDFAVSEHDADLFDPIGLLAYIAAGRSWTSDEAEAYWRFPAGSGGAYVPRQVAAGLLARVGVERDADRLAYVLAEMNDAAVPWSMMAKAVEAW